MSQKKYYELLKKEVKEQFTILQHKYSITNEDKQTFFDKILKSPLTRKKNKVDPGELCRARKQDGEQCTRRKKQGKDFCGKHINNRRYGCFDNKNNIIDQNELITLKSIKIKDTNYYIDDHKILYDPNSKDGLYEVIGKLMDNQQIFLASSSKFTDITS